MGRATHGGGEIGAPELAEVVARVGGPADAFETRFSRVAPLGSGASRRSLDATRAWLGAEATGPWLWAETEDEAAGTVAVDVYVERDPDVRGFRSAHTGFAYHAPRAGWVSRLAIARGALEPLGPHDDVGAWGQAWQGFSTPDRPGGTALHLAREDIRADFEAAFAGTFRVERWRGADVHVLPRGLDGRLGGWLSARVAIAGEWRYPTDAGERVGYDLLPAARDRFRRDWGHAYAEDEYGTFVGPGGPGGRRRVPDDFLGYLGGRAGGFALATPGVPPDRGRPADPLPFPFDPKGPLDAGDVPDGLDLDGAAELVRDLAGRWDGDAAGARSVASAALVALLRRGGHAAEAERLASVTTASERTPGR